MARPRKEKCACGKVKTVHNTSQQVNNPELGTKGFNYQCKECSTARVRERHWKDKHLDEMCMLFHRHEGRAIKSWNKIPQLVVCELIPERYYTETNNHHRHVKFAEHVQRYIKKKWDVTINFKHEGAATCED